MALVWAFWPRRACCQLWRSWAWPPSATPKRHPTYKTCFSPLKTHNMAKHWQAGKTPTQFEWNESTSMYFLLSNWWMGTLNTNVMKLCERILGNSSHGWVGFFPFFFGRKETHDRSGNLSPQQSAANNPIPGLRFDKEAHRGQEGWDTLEPFNGGFTYSHHPWKERKMIFQPNLHGPIFHVNLQGVIFVMVCLFN